MFSRAGARVGLCAVALLAISVLLPLAAGDHAYSHRYVIFGRVVDADGNPVPGLTVRLGLEHVETEGNCAAQPGTETEAFGRTETRPVTNQYGEFIFCSHVHSMSRQIPGKAILQVAEANVTKEIELDPYKRVSMVVIDLPEAHPRANTTVLDESYTVLGRLWREGSGRVHVEGIRVFGDTLDNAAVDITLDLGGGQTLKVNTTTNNYGDFAVRIPVSARPQSGTVTVETINLTYSAPVDGKSGVTTFSTELPKESSGTFAKVAIAVGLLAAAAAVIVGAAIAFKRASAKREAAVVRAASQRRRANK